ncbi:hypothetical protein HAX54_016213 [Datura stramonium]|uniref:Uncharacterized protein n=1 Tax=Datura stramonium TaxID=4076 RepID=A0ABS8UKR7_DATST|nr:hypothetical protein [Datura stramonium]
MYGKCGIRKREGRTNAGHFDLKSQRKDRVPSQPFSRTPISSSQPSSDALAVSAILEVSFVCPFSSVLSPAAKMVESVEVEEEPLSKGLVPRVSAVKMTDRAITEEPGQTPSSLTAEDKLIVQSLEQMDQGGSPSHIGETNAEPSSSLRSSTELPSSLCWDGTLGELNI